MNEKIKKRKFKDLNLDEQYQHVIKDVLLRQKKYVIFTRHYKFGDGIYDDAFNDRINSDVKMQTIMIDKKKDLTKRFYEALRYRIENGDHIILIFFGRTNSSKSWTAIRLSYDIRKMFKEELENSSEIHLCFSDTEYINEIPKMHKRDIMIRDETPNITGTGSTILQKNLDNVSAITRAGQYCFLFLCPKRINADVVSYYLEPAGIWKEAGKARFLLYNDEMRFLGRVYIKRPDDDDFLKEYERKKAENIKKIKDQAGLVGVEIDLEKVKADKKRLLRISRENGARRKSEIRAMIQKYNVENPKDKITGLVFYLENLINLVYLEQKKKSSEKAADVDFEKELTKDEIVNFDFSDFKLNIAEDEIIKDLVKNADSLKWKNPKRDFKIYKSKKNGISQRNLAKEYKLSKAAITIIIQKFKGRISKKIGKLFEEEFVNHLKAKEFFDDVKRFGGKGEPDIIGYKGQAEYVFSLKLRNIKAYPVIFTPEELSPEYKWSFDKNLKRKKVYLFLIFYDINLNTLKIRQLNPLSPKVQSFKR